MRVLNPDGSETRAKIQVGQSYTRQAGADHTIVNGGSETIEFIEIEKLL
jgi:mannose-6-phosphate isomerase-like protein (cupin superfamily)